MAYRWSPAVALQVTDKEAARRFYGGVLGFELKDEDGQTAIAGQPVQIYLDQAPKAETWFELLVPDVASAKAELLANGCTLHETAEAGEVFVRDPFGLIFHLHQS